MLMNENEKKETLNKNIKNILKYINETNKILNNYEKLILKEYNKKYLTYSKKDNENIKKDIKEINKTFNEILLLIENKENLKRNDIFNYLYYNENDYFIIMFKNYDKFKYLLKKLIINILNINKYDYDKYKTY